MSEDTEAGLASARGNRAPDPDRPSTGTPSVPIRASVLPWLIVVAAFALALAFAHVFPLLDPDEGRNAEVAREMAVDGDLLVPHLAGMPYLDKPPALFWLGALSIRAFGAEPWAARLPAALAAALTLGLIVHRALKRADRGVALRTVALLAAAPLFAVLAAYVIFDMLLTLCVTTVWLGLADELDDGPSARGRLFMFAAITLGVLTKGPVMLLWALGGSASGALLLRSRQPLAWLAWWPGWLLVFGVAGGWFTLASQRFPEYPRYAFLEESFQRVATGSFHRQQPLWFVPAVLIAGALPWSLATPWGREMSRSSRVGFGFVAFALVFFTLSRSKLVTYLLPALPMLAWAAGEAWSDRERMRRGAWGLAIVYGVLAIALAIAAFSGVLGRMRPPLDPSAALGAKVLAGCLGYIALRSVMAAGARSGSAFAGTVLLTPVALFALSGPLLSYAGATSGAPLARAIQALEPAATVRYEACYSPGTDFLLGRRSTLVSTLGRETTSEYQARYRTSLIARHQWTPLPSAPEAGDDVAVIVRSSRAAPGQPAGYVEFYRDERFVAYRKDAAQP